MDVADSICQTIRTPYPSPHIWDEQRAPSHPHLPYNSHGSYILCVSLSPCTASSQPVSRVSDGYTLALHLSMVSASFQRALGSSPWSKSLYRSGPRCLLFLVTGLPLAGSAPVALDSSLCQAPTIHAKSSLASDMQMVSYWEPLSLPSFLPVLSSTVKLSVTLPLYSLYN